jgi:hypothetical protein
MPAAMTTTTGVSMPGPALPGVEPDPKPISAALQRHFDQVLSQIPTGKSGQVGLAVTTAGMEASVGAKRGGLTATVYAGREWTSGWLAGGRVAWAF